MEQRFLNALWEYPLQVVCVCGLEKRSFMGKLATKQPPNPFRNHLQTTASLLLLLFCYALYPWTQGAGVKLKVLWPPYCPASGDDSEMKACTLWPGVVDRNARQMRPPWGTGRGTGFSGRIRGRGGHVVSCCFSGSLINFSFSFNWKGATSLGIKLVYSMRECHHVNPSQSICFCCKMGRDLF